MPFDNRAEWRKKMIRKRKKLILLAVDLVVIAMVVFGFRVWLGKIPEKETVEVPIRTEIEEKLKEEGLGDRVSSVPGMNLVESTIEVESPQHFTELYLNSDNHFRNELVVFTTTLTDKRTDPFAVFQEKGETQYFGYLKHYAVISEGSKAMSFKDTYRYEARSPRGLKQFNIEEIKDGKISFAYDPGVGYIRSMIALSLLVLGVLAAISIGFLYQWG